MTLPHLLSILPLLLMLLWAAITDIQSRRIRNWLSFSVILSGILRSFLFGPLTPTEALLGMLAGASLPLVLFALGALGGGDVKLLAGVGAWLGPIAGIQAFCIAAIIGMVIVIAQALAQGRLRTLSRNSAVLAINLAHIGDVGIEHATATGRSSKSIEKPLPYAVPIFLAVIALIGLATV